jgi:hypothetical protein
MTDWLKSWGLPDDRLEDDWKNHRGGLLTRRATYRRQPSVRPGDRLFYYAVGHRVVFGLYEAVSLPFQSGGDDEWDWHVKVEPIVDLDFLHDGIPVEALSVSDRNVTVALRQKAAIRLKEEEAAVAEEELRDRARTGGSGSNG